MSDDTLPRHAAFGVTEGIHIAYSFTVADAAAMAAGSVVDPGPGTRTVDELDEGKIARRLSDQTYWILKSYSPVAWLPIVPVALDPMDWAWQPGPWTRYQEITASIGGNNAYRCLIGTQGTAITYFPHGSTAYLAEPNTHIASSAAANAVAEQRFQHPYAVIGSAAGVGGFLFDGRFGTHNANHGERFFCGVSTYQEGAQASVDPLTQTTYGTIGIARGPGSANFCVVHNAAGAAPTVVDLGASYGLVAEQVWRFKAYATPNASSIRWAVLNESTGLGTSGTITANFPAGGPSLSGRLWVATGATVAQANARLFHLRIAGPGV